MILRIELCNVVEFEKLVPEQMLNSRQMLFAIPTTPILPTQFVLVAGFLCLQIFVYSVNVKNIL